MAPAREEDRGRPAPGGSLGTAGGGGRVLGRKPVGTAGWPRTPGCGAERRGAGLAAEKRGVPVRGASRRRQKRLETWQRGGAWEPHGEAPCRPEPGLGGAQGWELGKGCGRERGSGAGVGKASAGQGAPRGRPTFGKGPRCFRVKVGRPAFVPRFSPPCPGPLLRIHRVTPCRGRAGGVQGPGGVGPAETEEEEGELGRKGFWEGGSR